MNETKGGGGNDQKTQNDLGDDPGTVDAGPGFGGQGSEMSGMAGYGFGNSEVVDDMPADIF